MASLINAKKVKRKRKRVFNRMLKYINTERKVLNDWSDVLNNKKKSDLSQSSDLLDNDLTCRYKPHQDLYISSLYSKIEELIKICQSQNDKIFVLENKIKNDEKIIMPTKCQVKDEDTSEDHKSSVKYEESSEDEEEYLNLKKSLGIVRPADCSFRECHFTTELTGRKKYNVPIASGYIKHVAKVYHICNKCEMKRILSGGNPNDFIGY